MKTVGRSILESMLFLAVLGSAITFVNSIPALRDFAGMPTLVYIPVLSAGASLVVAFAFPKPTFWSAFLKLFTGGLLTFAIFAGLSVVLGPAVFTVVLDWLWSAGAAVWDWSSVQGIAAGIISVIMYIMFTLIIVGIIFAGLFALTNFFVLLVMNMFSANRQQAAEASAQGPSDRPKPFS
jgi:cbb3-type cytochrome oxidase subunit 3